MTIRISAPPGGKIKQYDTDPSPLNAETAWVLRTEGSTAPTTEGMPMGLLMALTYPATVTSTATTTYELSYRTKEGSTYRIDLTQEYIVTE